MANIVPETIDTVMAILSERKADQDVGVLVEGFAYLVFGDSGWLEWDESRVEHVINRWVSPQQGAVLDAWARAVEGERESGGGDGAAGDTLVVGLLAILHEWQSIMAVPQENPDPFPCAEFYKFDHGTKAYLYTDDPEHGEWRTLEQGGMPAAPKRTLMPPEKRLPS